MLVVMQRVWHESGPSPQVSPQIDNAIVQALAPAQWVPLYGMLKDQFGMIRGVDVVSQYNAA